MGPEVRLLVQGRCRRCTRGDAGHRTGDAWGSGGLWWAARVARAGVGVGLRVAAAHQLMARSRQACM